MNIKKIVKKLVEKYGTNNPFELAECLGIKILYEPLGNIRGFYQACPKNKIIHINNALDELNRLLVCAHELGHAMLHAKLNILFIEKNTFYIKNKYEIEANMFSSELLIQDDLINHYPEYFTMEQIAASINMPKELLQLKLN
ncbi:ImmA/IrrE family metallo-endopeptidase [Clostridium swellfunianum]|uniref:ImmA/IrrE family metallo-endopeptidase n=1 Tax=Clostridium swellfunianum TaxID=1367462 RepID=UPI00202FCCDB|nr:ImmA/IrrE family metallo-endopeptidase [Clostridium swellfunianum]MCM0648685.1 ImmA/IrrE family metallo-endopeptidase [Clostridium swellfunianum]